MEPIVCSDNQAGVSGVAGPITTTDPRELIYKSFMESIAWRLDGVLLRYSNRRHLLSLGRSLGIGEFEANLLMAAVLHQARQVVVPENSTVSPRWRQVLTIASVQLAIIAIVAAILWRLW